MKEKTENNVLELKAKRPRLFGSKQEALDSIERLTKRFSSISEEIIPKWAAPKIPDLKNKIENSNEDPMDILFIRYIEHRIFQLFALANEINFELHKIDAFLYENNSESRKFAWKCEKFFKNGGRNE
jgi:hypothetical protein